MLTIPKWLKSLHPKPLKTRSCPNVSEKLKRLSKNAAECTNCGARIQSKTRHDFQTCDCWDTDPKHGIFIDGGLSYHRHGYRDEYDYIDRCEYEDVDE